MQRLEKEYFENMGNMRKSQLKAGTIHPSLPRNYESVLEEVLQLITSKYSQSGAPPPCESITNHYIL